MSTPGNDSPESANPASPPGRGGRLERSDSEGRPNASAGAPPRDAPKLALAFIVATVLIDTIGLGIVIPVFPGLITELTGKSVAEAAAIGGWLGMAYAVMQFIFGPVVGGLSDRFGRKPVLLACLAAFSLDYFVSAFAPNIWWLLVARLVAGITGASFTVAYAFIADITPPEKRAGRFGLVGVAFGLGFIIGPALGGIVGQYGHHVPFMVAGALAAANFVLGLFVLPESLAAENRRPYDWRRANPLGALRQVRRLGRVAGALTLGLFLWFVANQALQGLWSFYATWRYQWRPEQVGWSLAAVGVGSVLVQGLFIKRFVKRFGETSAATVGISCGVVAFLLYGLAVDWRVGAVGILFGALAGLAYPSIQAILSKQVPADAQGELQGAVATISSLSVIVGPPLMTHLFSLTAGDDRTNPAAGLPYFLASALALVTLVLVRRSARA